MYRPAREPPSRGDAVPRGGGVTVREAVEARSGAAAAAA